MRKAVKAMYGGGNASKAHARTAGRVRDVESEEFLRLG